MKKSLIGMTLRLDPEVHALLKKHAHSQGLGIAPFIRSIVMSYINKHDLK